MQCNAEQRAHCNCCVCNVVVKYICISALVSFILSCLHSGAPQITVSALNYVIQGDTLIVNCSVSSFPQSSVSLSLGDTPIMTSVSEAYDSTAGSITYFTTHSTMAVHPSDEGNYTCSATITHGQPAVTEVFSDTVFVAIYGGSCSHSQNDTHQPSQLCNVHVLMIPVCV